MIDKIKGLKKYNDCSMPSNEQQRIEKAECAAYNQAIEDVVKLFAIHNVVGQSEQLPTCEHKYIIGGDGCFECGDCGLKFY